MKRGKLDVTCDVSRRKRGDFIIPPVHAEYDEKLLTARTALRKTLLRTGVEPVAVNVERKRKPPHGTLKVTTLYL